MRSLGPDLLSFGHELVDPVTAKELRLRAVAIRLAYGGELIERHLDGDVLETRVGERITPARVIAVGTHPLTPVPLAHLFGCGRVVDHHDSTPLDKIDGAAKPLGGRVVTSDAISVAARSIAELTIVVDVDDHVVPVVARSLTQVEREVVEQFVREHDTDDAFVRKGVAAVAARAARVVYSQGE